MVPLFVMTPWGYVPLALSSYRGATFQVAAPASLPAFFEECRRRDLVEKRHISTDVHCGGMNAPPWHGRGRRFEPVQVHQNFSNTYRPPHPPERNRRSPTGVQTPFDAWAATGIVWISIPAHDQANRFNEVASLGTLGTVFRAGRRLSEATTFRFHIRTMPIAPHTRHASVADSLYC